MSFLIPRSAVILRPASSHLYSAVLFVDASLGKCIWITYLRCSPVGATSSTPALAPCKEKAPSKYMIHLQLASLPGRAVSLGFFVRRCGPFCNELRQDSALNRRSTFKLEAKAGQLQCPFHSSSCCIWIVQYPLQREASDDSDLVCLEVVTQLPRGHKKAEEQFLHAGVP